MERVPVESRSLVSVGYDSTTSTLEVEFRNGSIYQYFGVSAHIYEGLMNATSKGRPSPRFVTTEKYIKPKK